MTNHIDVVDHNPIGFLNTVAQKLADGYVIRQTNEGVPFFGPYHYSVRLFKGEQRSGVIIPASFAHTMRVEHYEALPFMILFENAIIAGYEFDLTGAHFFDERSFKSVQMKEKPAKAAKEPQKKAPAKKALKAEPTKSELEGE